MQIPARPPTGTAMAAASLDVLSGGRFRLGLGLSGPQVSEGWYGVPFVRPAARTREYVDTVRRALAREAVQLPVEGGTGLGRPLKLLAKPVQDAIPVYLGAIGPRAVVQAGEIADGWLPFLFQPGRAGHPARPAGRGPRARGPRAPGRRHRARGPGRRRRGRRRGPRGRPALAGLLPRGHGRQGQELL